MQRSRLHRAFGRRVRELRYKRGYTQERLAEKSGLHVTYLGRIERGTRNPSLTSIGRLAKAFRVPLTELFEGA